MAKIKSNNGVSISQQLVKILGLALPQSNQTGIQTHCRNVHLPVEGKGKVVNFEYQHRYFRITEAVKVYEYSFGFHARRNLEVNAMTQEIEAKIALVK